MTIIMIDEIKIDCPDDLYDWLKQEADRTGQSIESIVVEILQTAFFFYKAK